jgi:phosphohistidine phosphatase SixA
MPTIDLYLVRHAESCGNITQTKMNTYRKRHRDILHEPGLSLKGYIQSFLLRDYLPKSIKYDKVICSPLVRTVITAMISLSTFNNEPNPAVIHIVPYIKFHNTKLSRVNNVTELKEKVHNFKVWFHKTGIHMYQLFSQKHTKSPKNVTAIHFPSIDYAALEDYEHQFRENERIHVIERFQEYISKLKGVSTLLIFTHKRFIMNMNQTLKVPKNTSITKMIVDVVPNNTLDIKSSKIIYTPRINHTLKIKHKSELEMCRSSKLSLSKTRKRIKIGLNRIV